MPATTSGHYLPILTKEKQNPLLKFLSCADTIIYATSLLLSTDLQMQFTILSSQTSPHCDPSFPMMSFG